MAEKEKAWNGLNLTLVAPSRWMADCAASSSLFRNARVEVIPNGIDTDLFKPVHRQQARESLSLPQDKRLILFGSKGVTSDRNKGFHLLVEALRLLVPTSLELVVFGTQGPDRLADYGVRTGVRTHYLGWQMDETRLAWLYAAADAFVFPSMQESLGYAAMEAMACGTPCVAFNQGGVSDLIDHGHNGYLAQPFEPADLARGIAWVLEDCGRWDGLCRNARKKIEDDFAIEKVAQRHIDLYRRVRFQP